VTGSAPSGAAPKSLPLILARELASNLATPMFLLDAAGMLVFFNDAAAVFLGRTFAEVGEIPASEFGAMLCLTTLDGVDVRRRDSPAGVALLQQRPAHAKVMATGFSGERRAYEATAYPLFGAEGEMHGVINVFWEDKPAESSN
jgi:PAS domain-containing protein